MDRVLPRSAGADCGQDPGGDLAHQGLFLRGGAGDRVGVPRQRAQAGDLDRVQRLHRPQRTRDHGDAGRWGLSAVALLAGVLVLYFFWRTPRSDDRILGSLALLLAGIAGNVVDRLRLGFVVDFIDLNFWPLRDFAVFNVADSSIVVGVIILALVILVEERRERSAPQAVAAFSVFVAAGQHRQPPVFRAVLLLPARHLKILA